VMARINYPEDFLNQTVLFENMKTKHDADGAGSPLNDFLTQQGIDLVADEAATGSAIDTNKLFDSTSKAAEDNTQDRNNLFDPVFDRLKTEVQFLKKFYAGNPAELGNWGVTVNGNAIVYPPDFLNRVELFKTFKIHHDSFPGSSPLDPFLTQQNINLNDDLADTAAAEVLHATMEQAKKNAEDLREERDISFDPVMGHVRLIGQFLKSLFVDHPKHLGDWGYVVDDSPRDPKFRTATIDPTLSRTLTGAKLNS
jgi:hypothetical protein